MRLTETKLIIEVPREALKNAQLSQIEEILTGCIFNGAYRFQNDLKGHRHGNFNQNSNHNKEEQRHAEKIKTLNNWLQADFKNFIKEVFYGFSKRK
ncbi:hypothetical protein JP0101_10950 [Helicobacter pylori]|nr:hypothetical protein JP0101_10950 [Helicobacter pylori]